MLAWSVALLAAVAARLEVLCGADLASERWFCYEGPGDPGVQTLVPREAVHPREEALQVVEMWAEPHGEHGGQEVGAVCAVEGVVV